MKTHVKIITIPDFLVFLVQVHKTINQSVTDIQLETKITYSHLHNMKKVLKDRGLITIQKVSVKTIINLTEAGIQVAKKTLELFELLNITNDNMLNYRRKGKRTINKEDNVKKDNIVSNNGIVERVIDLSNVKVNY